MIVIGRGSVQQEECDVMGHMNVRHYVARVADALAWLMLEAGLPRLVQLDQHIRFLREMAPGTPFTIRGGILAAEPDRIRTLAEIRNTATDMPAAAFITDLGLRDEAGGPLPPGAAMAALRVPCPDHAGPRGLAFDPPRAVPDRMAAHAMGLKEG